MAPSRVTREALKSELITPGSSPGYRTKKTMTLQEYIVKNYNNLPKSTFNDNSCVIFQEDRNEDEGWGHHMYEGYGVTVDGNRRRGKDDRTNLILRLKRHHGKNNQKNCNHHRDISTHSI